MRVLPKAWKVYAALGSAYWISQAYGVSRLLGLPTVEQMPLDESRTAWPRVSVIIPACNEEDAVEDAVRSRLEDDYPELEIILINDRSTDSTGAIVDRLASEDRRLKAVHVEELPEGWLGKVHAMNEGLRAATGEWLLLSDGDVYVRRGTIKRTVSFAEEGGFDHLAVLPELLPANLPIDVGLSVFSRLLCVGGRVWAVSDPRSSAAVGYGAFNLVHRNALEASKGLEWLKLEVADDITLGQMLKASGASQQFAKGNGFIGVNMVPSIRDALKSTERALFTSLGHCSLLRSAALGMGIAAIEISPLALALRRRDGLLRRLGLFLLVVQAGMSIAFNKWLGRPVWHTAFMPLAPAGLAALMIRAGILGAARGGIYWRGTFYPTEQLKSGRRFRP